MCEESISQKTILLSKAYLKVLDDPTYTTKPVLFSIKAYKRKLWLSTYQIRVIIWSVYLPLVSEDLNLYKISFSNNFSVKNLHGFLISLATINYNLFWVHSQVLYTSSCLNVFPWVGSILLCFSLPVIFIYNILCVSFWQAFAPLLLRFVHELFISKCKVWIFY